MRSMATIAEALAIAQQHHQAGRLLQAEQILRTIPELSSYSRRTGARLALSIAESLRQSDAELRVLEER